MTKYDALAEFLREQPPGRVTMTFEEINDLVPGGLPASAFEHRAWWANESHGRHVQSAAWITPGWRVQRLDLTTQQVTFEHGPMMGAS